MKPERIQWKRTKGRNQLLLDKIYDAITEEFSRDAMASLATVLAHICIITDVAKPKAIEAFGNVYDETRDKLGSECRCRSSDHRHRLRMDRLGLDATAAGLQSAKSNR